MNKMEDREDIKSAIDNAEEMTSAKRPVVRVKAGQLSATATRCEAVLKKAGVKVFQRAGMLVRPVIETVDASHGRRTPIAQLTRLDPVYLRDLLGRVAD